MAFVSSLLLLAKISRRASISGWARSRDRSWLCLSSIATGWLERLPDGDIDPDPLYVEERSPPEPLSPAIANEASSAFWKQDAHWEVVSWDEHNKSTERYFWRTRHEACNVLSASCVMSPVIFSISRLSLDTRRRSLRSCWRSCSTSVIVTEERLQNDSCTIQKRMSQWPDKGSNYFMHGVHKWCSLFLVTSFRKKKLKKQTAAGRVELANIAWATTTFFNQARLPIQGCSVQSHVQCSFVFKRDSSVRAAEAAINHATAPRRQ